ncbi:cilia- and flagella-associated protein 97-like [Dendroctonus ponderosae]|uniref:Cilia- and flagella-associated protein 97 n=1 Tax=Dendroctonus ponderosae TaxID=77166 RepID=A0AAR5PUQ1_DENPD|nr:cilia- and flagella-associated protein 97-like [Dendroctonus ponderosae]KAH1020990.1 hypothetical protein HUJ04_010569 [Dendroctonus ponderosae]KAH1027967.1 hypothetical protein HUJ05_001381 [Dendroctonus ponderosae]
MSSSDESNRLNNCVTCEQIKYSQEDETLSSNSEGKQESVESLRLNFNQSKLEKIRHPTVQQNKTFSLEKVREIERRNSMLVNRILYHNRRPNQYKLTVASLPKITSAEINRRRFNEKIAKDNQILLKKIQSVKPAVRYP